MEDRRALMQALDGLDRAADRSGALEGLDRFDQQAFDLILRDARRRLDLADEDPRLVDRYDTSDIKSATNSSGPARLAGRC